MTQRGRTSGLPVLVTSFPDFKRKFGGYLKLPSAFNGHTYLPHAVEGFFTNGGKRLYIMRVKSQDAQKASVTAQGGLVTRLKENAQVPQSGKPQQLKVATLRGIQIGTKLQLRMVKDGIVNESSQLTVTKIKRQSNEITVDQSIPREFNAQYTTVFTNIKELNNSGVPIYLANPFSTRLNTFKIEAKNEGSWGDEILIQSFHESAAKAEMDKFVSGALNENKIRLKSTAGFYAKAWVEIDRGNTKPKLYRRVKSVDGTVLTLEGQRLANTDLQLQAPATTTIFSTCEFGLVLSYNGVSEQFSGLTLENIPGRYYFDKINNASTLISVEQLSSISETHPFLFPSGSSPSESKKALRILLGGGSDGAKAPLPDDYKGTDPGPGKRTGIKALEDIDQISIIAAPGITSQRVQEALINQCELLKDRFAILDPKPKNGDAPDLDDIEKQRKLYDTKYAAIYYPRLMAYDPIKKVDLPIPPSGHIAGIYARSDIEQGVHKAPANEVIRGIRGLELTINKGEQDIRRW